jgi:uncharacterized membrane protein (DUF2068 family)
METSIHTTATPSASASGGPRPSRPRHTHHNGSGVVRLIGLYKLLKAAVMVVLGIAILHLVHQDLDAVLDRVVDRLHLDPCSPFLVEQVQPRLAHLNPTRLRLIGWGAFAYCALYTVQGLGLLAARRWAEWLTVVSGVLLVPLEVFELCRHPTPFKAIILISNVAIAVYLYYHVRHRTAAAEAAA